MNWDALSDKLGAFGEKVGQGLKLTFGSRNQRYIRDLAPLVRAINEREAWAKGLTAEQFKAQTTTWREAIAAGTQTLEDVLPESFALVREAAVRTLGMRHFDVQLVGGVILHRGAAAEMMTGEGKTLVATLPLYLNSLEGKPVYLVTVNDYLARRDAEWMRPVYEYLGVSVGAIQSSMLPWERGGEYSRNIVYGTNNEFGFDYLRDNMKVRVEDQVQKYLHYAIIDEVDSILIDEARTPLIISGPAEQSSDKYRVANGVAKALQKELHYEIKEKERTASLLEEGIVVAQQLVGVDSFYTPGNEDWPHFIENAIRAHEIYLRDREYVVEQHENGQAEVVIVDEFTGRKMTGRRWSDGLHQAVETKEGLPPRQENQTLATITFQNYFRLFDKLAGMTGTALTEANEFHKVYGLDVVSVPTNLPLARVDVIDTVYRTEPEKWKAIVAEIAELHERGQPVLVGTTTVENSEKLSGALRRQGVPHEVLNAKNHEREAHIVANAGVRGAVTVSTNMAGRGTDIKLGGNQEYRLRQALEAAGLREGDEQHLAEIDRIRASVRAECEAAEQDVLERGGLYVLGTERHEARRIDNQLRGRSGRQGNVGKSRFFLSLEDPLMRRFYRDWVKNFMQRLGMEEGVPIESRMVTRAIEKAQKKVEDYNFEVRKSLLEYDEVMDQQRKTIYGVRQEVLEQQGLREKVEQMLVAAVNRAGQTWAGDAAGFRGWFQKSFGNPVSEQAAAQAVSDSGSTQAACDEILKLYDEREQKVAPEVMRRVEQWLLLESIDAKWKDHLHAIDALKTGIGLRGYGQVDPKNEYKREGFELFQRLLEAVEEQVASLILRLRVRGEDDAGETAASIPEPRRAQPTSYAGPAKTVTPQQAAQIARSQALRGARRVPAAQSFDLMQRQKRLRELQEAAEKRAGAGAEPAPGEAAAAEPEPAAAPVQGANPAAPSAPAARRAAEESRPGAALQGLSPSETATIGRNDPCPCGSGKKYKKCHGS